MVTARSLSFGLTGTQPFLDTSTTLPRRYAPDVARPTGQLRAGAPWAYAGRQLSDREGWPAECRLSLLSGPNRPTAPAASRQSPAVSRPRVDRDPRSPPHREAGRAA